jgi:hypothetical protein
MQDSGDLPGGNHALSRGRKEKIEKFFGKIGKFFAARPFLGQILPCGVVFGSKFSPAAQKIRNRNYA